MIVLVLQSALGGARKVKVGVSLGLRVKCRKAIVHRGSSECVSFGQKRSTV
ncbi:hypothetical protein Plhal304r1_c050g0132821 [Plasmopara halstedii]